MALKPCSECGAQISTEAASCPQCGAPLKQERRGKNYYSYWPLFVVVSVLFIIWAAVHKGRELRADEEKEEKSANAQLNKRSSIRIESDAVIAPNLQGEPQFFEDTVKLIRAFGYKCDSISAASPMTFSRGFEFVCNDFAYDYEIEDKGGNWRVTLK